MPSNRRKRSRDTTPARSSVRMTKAGKAKEKVAAKPAAKLPHASQKAGYGRLIAAVETHGAGYLVAPPGMGKTHGLPLAFVPCSYGAAANNLIEAVSNGAAANKLVKVVNIVAVPSGPLVQELNGKIPSLTIPSFTLKKDTPLLKELLEEAVDGETISLSINHTALRALLKGSMSELLDGIGKPDRIMLFIDEAHNLCAGATWADLLQGLKRVFRTVEFGVVLISATPKLEEKRFMSAALTFLGTAKKDMTVDVLNNEALIEFTPAEMAKFKDDLCPLEKPGEWTVEELPSPRSCEGFKALLKGELEDLKVLVLGNFCYLLQCQIDKVLEPKKARRVEIHAGNAKRNLVSAILSILSLHSPSVDGSQAHFNGGPFFEVMSEEQVKAVRVPDNGKLDKDKRKWKVEDVSESVLVVHSEIRGLMKHYGLLNELHGSGAVPPFATPFDFSLGEVGDEGGNLARDDSEHAKFNTAFQKQEDGDVLGLGLLKKIEGSDRYASNVTKAIVFGPVTDKMKESIEGRFHRPTPSLKPKSLVRRHGTQLVHLDSSEWAKPVLAIESSRGGALPVSDIEAIVMTRVQAIQGRFDDATKGYLEQVVAKLCKFGALVGDDLADDFLSLVAVSDDMAAYLHKGEREKKDGKMVLKPGEVDSNYWSVVHKWVKQVGEGDIEEEE